MEMKNDMKIRSFLLTRWILCLYLCVGFVVVPSVSLDAKSNTYQSEYKRIHLSSGGNVSAIYSPVKQIGSKHSKSPVIIYMYDEFLDRVTGGRAKEFGYDLDAHIQQFNQWGFSVIVPMEKFRKFRALKAAIRYAIHNEGLTQQDIHLIGLSEGAYMALFALEFFPDIKSVTVVAPQSIYSVGPFSLSQLNKFIHKQSTPVLFLSAKSDIFIRVKSEGILVNFLKKSPIRLKYKPYPVKVKWYRNEQNVFMTDIQRFIKKVSKKKL